MTLAAGSAAADDTALHQPWDEILGTYVVESEDGVNRFDYGALKANDADSTKLDAYLESFADLDFALLCEASIFSVA